MSSKNQLIKKISDYLESRQKTNNFGTCKKCSKNVYWSTTKVASHIRSGHCKGASDEEVQKFKQEFVYETPKHLIHRSCVGKTPRSADSLKAERDEKSESVTSIKKIYMKQELKDGSQAKRQKLELDEEYESENIIEENNDSEIMYELETANTDDEKIEELIFVTNDSAQETPPKKSEESVPASASKEEKFISAVYPQYKGRSKFDLIDEIFDLQRRNELLQVKVKTYENTINKLL
ncbi:uncharacterized protein [Chironomus tepperi]|uniref:uncharacterized protein n=1 Tax=Chironomus tepperi TaxID=113505 RepID=UPI00391F9856